jgi:hypothetical protein
MELKFTTLLHAACNMWRLLQNDGRLLSAITPMQTRPLNAENFPVEKYRKHGIISAHIFTLY